MGTHKSAIRAGRQTLGLPVLILDWRAVHVALDETRAALVLGAQDSVDLRVSRPHVSRSHGRIERRGDEFVLVDDSTNGTWIQTGDGSVAYVHRAEFQLRGDGWLSLGEPLSERSLIRFRRH
jgi:adenylate cyclase